MAHAGITKTHFLANLEKALKQLILNRLFDDADEKTKQRLNVDVEDFIRENAADYTIEELKETFVSAEAAIALFLEYQDVKHLDTAPDKAPASGPRLPSSTGGIACGSCGGSGEGGPTYPSDHWEEPLTGMEFVWVSGAQFEMGSGHWDDQGHADEKPVHTVQIDGFWAGKFPVTVAQYAKFVTEMKSNEPVWLEIGSKYNIHTGNDPLYKALGHTITSDNYPIAGVSWHDATAFAQWLTQKTGLSFHLPTEAAWEFAARSGGLKEKFAGGHGLDAVAWYTDNSNGTAHPVGQKRPNGLGLYDMGGNVTEWCMDRYDKFAYAHHRMTNPVNTENGTCRVVRGGSWNYGARDVRCADRGLFVPEHRDCDLGFRIFRSA